MAGQPDQEMVADAVAQAAARRFALFWLAELRKVEEQILEPAARWEILRRALERVSRGG